ncbi:protein of unknown function [Paraburkholderia dioscoreae]|uniref:Uncharacterized protein n=1 Tax=Paraburkholderia dioscoreae TaxID=2604047 RepID=A0A5Q4ZJT8_9BURK|nr:protein of unknown function [Paraburkholderia dioscoreae]
MHGRAPLRIRHERPVILIEAWRILDPVGACIEHEAPVVRVERERAPRYGVQRVAHAEKTAGGQHRVGDPAAAYVEHDVGDFADVLAVRRHHLVSVERGCRHDVWSGTVTHADSNNICALRAGGCRDLGIERSHDVLLEKAYKGARNDYACCLRDGVRERILPVAAAAGRACYAAGGWLAAGSTLSRVVSLLA